MSSEPRSADRDLRRAILEAAEAEVIEHGAAGASLRAVARRAGVSHQAPGHFFGNRAGLLTAVAVYEVAKLGARLQQVAEESATLPARDRLTALGVAYIQFAYDHQALFSLALRSDVLVADDEQLAVERGVAWSVLAEAVADAQRDGWRGDQPLEEVALLCWTVVHGTATAWIDGLLRSQLPHMPIEQIAHTVTATL